MGKKEEKCIEQISDLLDRWRVAFRVEASSDGKKMTFPRGSLPLTMFQREKSSKKDACGATALECVDLVSGGDAKEAALDRVGGARRMGWL